ncbi:zinc-binding dehydrogenase [Brevibacterium sp.]|uniref:zinc-binding dehydrogenase n=1 Tax=Brevibacterium sp. TaxID=1701 RepID=UPI002810A37D|nr:zinc-binding dehydrogenase [Brevibacterium sp.]
MRVALAVSQNSDEPLEGLRIADVPYPEPEPGWTRVKVRAATLNPHDVWTLRGVGHPAERIPIVLGCDGAGVTDDGREVIIYPVLGDPAQGYGDETLDPARSIFSERVDGVLAEYVLVPTANLVPKPKQLDFAECAALGAAWATAYRMIFTRGCLQPGSRVLVQGASGGVAGAAIRMAAAAGAHVCATGRTVEKREYALSMGAHEALEPGRHVPEKVDLVIETVGEATWSHSMRCVRDGGIIVVAGATTGGMPPADLQRIFYRQLSIVGSVMATRTEFEQMLRMLDVTGIRPSVDSRISLDEVVDGYRRMIAGELQGKIVVEF